MCHSYNEKFQKGIFNIHIPKACTLEQMTHNVHSSYIQLCSNLNCVFKMLKAMTKILPSLLHIKKSYYYP